MPKAPVRILVVDDFEPFRHLLCSTLQANADFHIISELSDGLQAVEQARELQPDLVLLDIGLPRLNGIEAARRIRGISPHAKILFLSQESSPDVVRAALAVGAMGYVVKADAARELLPAVEAVLRGAKFVGKRFAGRGPTTASTPCRHEAHFYADDDGFVDGCARCLATALQVGNVAIFVATQPHRDEVLARLQSQGVDIRVAIEERRYISLDAAETLAAFMVGDVPDRNLVLKLSCDLISAAAKAAKGDHPRVVACGECAPFLWAQGKVDAAIRLEQLWNEMGQTYNLEIQCGFVLTAFQREEQTAVFDSICAAHSSVVHSGEHSG